MVAQTYNVASGAPAILGGNAHIITPRKLDTATRDTARTWFSGPCARRVGDVVFYVGISKAGIVTTTGVNLKTLAAHAKDMTTSGFEIDDHNNGGIVRTTNGRLVHVYSSHNDSVLRWKVTDRAINTWQDWIDASMSTERTIPNPAGGQVSYGHSFVLTNASDRIYIVHRRWDTTADVMLSQIVDPEGASPTYPTPISLHNATTGRPYSKSASNGVDKIFVGFSSMHPNEGSRDIFCQVVNVAAGPTLSHTDAAGGAITVPTTVGTAPLVINYANPHRVWINDITFNASGHPRIAYPYYPSGGSSAIEARVNRWNGSAWVDNLVAIDGANLNAQEVFYPGTHVFHPSNPDRVIGSFTEGSVRNIREYEWNGSAWTKLRDITKNNPHQTDGAYHRMRPFAVMGADERMTAIWNHGKYNTFTTGFDLATWGSA